MSFVTTQPEMVTSAPSMSNPQLLAEGVHDYPRDGAGVDGSRRIERRRNGRSSDTPMDILGRLPAVVVLERIPVPSLAMARDGIILFANTAFAQMVGHRQDRLAGLAFPEIFHTVPVALWALLWRRCTGESGCTAAALRGLDGAGQDEQVGADAVR